MISTPMAVIRARSRPRPGSRTRLHLAGFARQRVVYRPSFKLAKKFWALCTNTPQKGRLIVHADAA